MFLREGLKYFFLFVLTLFTPLILPAAIHETLPSYHWAYQYIDELQSRGFLLDLWIMNRPYTRGQVARSVFKAIEKLEKSNSNYEFLKNRLDVLKQEFIEEVDRLNSNEKQDHYLIHSRFNLRHDGVKDSTERVKYRGVYRGGVSVNITDKIFGCSYVIFNQYNYYDPNYIGKKWRGLVGYTEQAYLSARWKNLMFKFGRDFIKWGVGNSGTLVMSDIARPLDQMLLSAKLGPFKFTYLISELDRYPGNVRRFLSSHRLDLNLFNGRIQAAVSEIVIYGGENDFFNFVYLNPLIFYHGAKKNGAGENNVLPTVDLLVFPYRNWQIYASFLIDDIQLEKTVPGDLEPNEIGWLAGSKYADPFDVIGLTLNFEYVRIANRTYKTRYREELFVHRNVPLGHPMGNDFYWWQITASYWMSKSLWIKMDYNRIRKGEGSLFTPWDQPWMEYSLEEGYHEPFPTGIVEKRNGINLEIYWFGSQWWRVSGGIEYMKIANAEHVSGKNKDVWNARVRFEFDWNVVKKWNN